MDALSPIINVSTAVIMGCAAIGVFFLLLVAIDRMLNYITTKIGAYIGLLAYVKEHYGEIRKWVRERQLRKRGSR